jgi:hypothetical protein
MHCQVDDFDSRVHKHHIRLHSLLLLRLPFLTESLLSDSNRRRTSLPGFVIKQGDQRQCQAIQVDWEVAS